MPIYSYRDCNPKLDDGVYLAPSADVIGDVCIGSDSSVWFNVVIRGDVNYVRIGESTNVQDGSIVHVTRDRFPTIIGNEVTIGHNCNIHGCTIHDKCLIGMGAILLDGCVIAEKSFIAAGALVPPGTVVPSGKLFGGLPGRIMRDLSLEELSFFEVSATRYVELKNMYINQRPGQLNLN